jgi:uncharacterized protein (TIGR03000 family)
MDLLPAESPESVSSLQVGLNPHLAQLIVDTTNLFREALDMYSVLISAVLSQSAATPQFGGWFNRGCLGCQGCVGCIGCSGCFGCGGCYGCAGGCRGGFLGLGVFGGRGCGGCFGCSGCFGSCYGCHGSCFGCYGMPIEFASGFAVDPVVVGLPGPSLPDMPDAEPTAPPSPALGETLAPATAAPPGLGEPVAAANQATIVVTLPADAKLFADGTLIDQPGPVRTFRTPPLEPGRTYYYNLAIEIQRGGQTVRSKDERVSLEAGKVARVNFPEPTPGTGNTAHIRIQMPADAVLTVDGQLWSNSGGVAVIQTPHLSRGVDHVYQLTVELVRQNQRHTLTRDVRFQAGQDVRVEFNEPAAHRIARR